MKKYILLSIAALFLVTCNNYENMVQQRGDYAVPMMSEPTPGYFMDDIASSFVSFDLSMPDGQKADKVSIEVTGKGQRAILKDVTLPVTGLRVTATEVLSALNISQGNYNLGDIFYLYVLTTKDGVTTRSSTAFAIPVICAFTSSMLAGEYYFDQPSWGEGIVTIEVSPLSNERITKIFIYGIAEGCDFVGNGNGVEINLNTNSFNLSGPKCVISANAWSYTGFALQAGSGSYNSCLQRFTITFGCTVDQGSFGNYTFVFDKQ